MHAPVARILLRGRSALAPALRAAAPLLRGVSSSASSASAAAPPPGVTVVSSRADAARVLAVLRAQPASTYHAVDTEVADIDLETQSPVVHGRVLCLARSSGPAVD